VPHRQDRKEPRSSPDRREWTPGEGAKLSPYAPVTEAIDDMLKRWEGFSRFLEDGRICLTNSAAEMSAARLALGKKPRLFAGSDRDADRAASCTP
jgi:transposase